MGVAVGVTIRVGVAVGVTIGVGVAVGKNVGVAVGKNAVSYTHLTLPTIYSV